MKIQIKEEHTRNTAQHCCYLVLSVGKPDDNDIKHKHPDPTHNNLMLGHSKKTDGFSSPSTEKYDKGVI